MLTEIQTWTEGAYSWAKGSGDAKESERAEAAEPEASSSQEPETNDEPTDERDLDPPVSDEELLDGELPDDSDDSEPEKPDSSQPDTSSSDAAPSADTTTAETDVDDGDSSVPKGAAPDAQMPRTEAVVQKKTDGRTDDPNTHEHAEHGVAGSGGPLPFVAQIQRAFGRHDVSNVKSHQGEAASKANAKMGSLAYAMGNRVAFRDTPSLHTAAHEAAHVVQQRAGVHLKDGVGRDGDEYERHADEVADAVVAGKSAEPILDRYSNSSVTIGSSSVQHKKVSRPPAFTLDQHPDWAENSSLFPSAQYAKQWMDGFGGENEVANEMNSHWDSMIAQVGTAESSLAAKLGEAKAAGTQIEGDEKSAMIQLRDLLEEAVGAMKTLDTVAEKFTQAKAFAALASASETKAKAEWEKETDTKKKAEIEAKHKAAATKLKANIKHAITGAKIIFGSGTPWAKAVKGIEYVGTLLVMSAVDDYYSDKAKDALRGVELGLSALTNKIHMAEATIVEQFVSISNSMTTEAVALNKACNTKIKQKLGLASSQVNAMSTRKTNGPLKEIFSIVESHKVAVEPHAAYILDVCRKSSFDISQITVGSDLKAGVDGAAKAVADKLNEEFGDVDISNGKPPSSKVPSHLRSVKVLASGPRLLVTCTTSLGMHADEGGVSHITARQALEHFPSIAAKIAKADASLKWHQDASAWGAEFETWKNAEAANLESMANYVATGQHMMVAKQAIAAANQMAGLGSFDLSKVKPAAIK